MRLQQIFILLPHLKYDQGPCSREVQWMHEVDEVQCNIYFGLIFKAEDLKENWGKKYVEIVDCGWWKLSVKLGKTFAWR
jgi:hypothetical protein